MSLNNNFTMRLKNTLERHPIPFLVMLVLSIGGAIFGYLNSYYNQKLELEKERISIELQKESSLLDLERTRIKFTIDNTSGVISKKNIFISPSKISENSIVSKSGDFTTPIINDFKAKWKWRLRSEKELIEEVYPVDSLGLEHLEEVISIRNIDSYESDSLYQIEIDGDTLFIRPRISCQYVEWETFTKVLTAQNSQNVSNLFESLFSLGGSTSDFSTNLSEINLGIYENKMFTDEGKNSFPFEGKSEESLIEDLANCKFNRYGRVLTFLYTVENKYSIDVRKKLEKSTDSLVLIKLQEKKEKQVQDSIEALVEEQQEEEEIIIEANPLKNVIEFVSTNWSFKFRWSFW